MTLTAPPRKRMRADERREQILDVTLAIVSAEGFHAATPGRVADESGVTRAVLYQSFGDMAGLFVALIDRENARASAQFFEAVAQSNPGEAANPFLGMLDASIRAIDASPATWQLFLFPPEGAPPELHRRLAESEARVRAEVQSRLIAEYPDLPDPEFTARIVHAAGREILRLHLTDPEQASPDRLQWLAEALVRMGHLSVE